MIRHSFYVLCFAFLLAMVMPVKAQLSEYDYNKPLGWATVDGTVTGSNDENPVTVTTCSELVNALSGTSAATIYVKGEIEFTTGVIPAITGNASVVSTRYITPSGMEVSQPQGGLIILREKMSDGTLRVRKVMVR